MAIIISCLLLSGRGKLGFFFYHFYFPLNFNFVSTFVFNKSINCFKLRNIVLFTENKINALKIGRKTRISS